MRFLLLPILACLAMGCSDPGAGLSPQEAYWAAETAIHDGETRRALALLRSAAERGHLESMDALADAHRDGYLRSTHSGSRFVALFPLPWEGERAARHWRDRHDQAVADGIAAGDPNLLLGVANRLRRSDLASERDSADALMASLLARGHAGASIQEALMTWQEDPDYANSLLARAEGAGAGQACLLRVTLGQSARFASAEVDTTVVSLARTIDAMEACPPMPPLPPWADPPGAPGLLANLREGASTGDRRSAAALDSLRQLGVFDRHPHLDT